MAILDFVCSLNFLNTCLRPLGYSKPRNLATKFELVNI